MSFAKIGSSATAPPSSTAKRSSEIAPSKTFVRRMRRTPASTASEAVHTLGRGRTPATQREHAAESDEREPDADRVDELGPEREEESADCRAGDERELERDRALGECAQRGSPEGRATA